MTITITTNPNPIIPGESATIIYTNTAIVQQNNNIYYLTNSLGHNISDIYNGATDAGNTFTFENAILDSGLNILNIYDYTSSKNIATFQIDISTACFKEGTKILSYVTKNQETYVPIENITDNMFIKTYKHGYKKVKYILKSRIINTSERSINKLFKMTKSKDNNLTEDLYITGSHAVLYDRLGEKQQNQMNNLVNMFDLDYNMNLDGKCKLIAYYDNNFEECNDEAYFNIYHLVLESDTPDTNYGIYANGILVESTDEITVARIKNVSLINSGFQPIDSGVNKGFSFKFNNNRIQTKIDNCIKNMNHTEFKSNYVLNNTGFSFKSNDSRIQSKMDNYLKNKNTEELYADDIIKKKELMNKNKVEKDEREMTYKNKKHTHTKSYTYKKTHTSKKNCTYKHG